MRDLRILTGSHLKLLAILFMVVDHTAAFLWRDAAWANEAFFVVGPREVTPYFLMRCVGRLSFPIFAFLIVEGFLHTRSRRKYGRNLLLFALASELPWNLVHTGTCFYPVQNIFFTLFLGYLGLCALQRFRARPAGQAAALVGLLAASILLRVDFGCSGYGFILLLYVLRDRPLPRAVIGSCLLPSRWIAGLAFIPLSLYNGRRGFVHGPVAKYAFYLFYPLHLLVLYFLKQ